ncbi:hypothetical protein [uncultured Microscilla sp.]|uniref:hypothetical protein n=1 Tax=uncultured Microscilla sp. TaxID=432653 RepID=UPI002626327E|nr:hypothetical protein [uncultured Microscilla sp.]
MSSIIIIFILVASIIAIISTSIGRFTNKTIDKVMKQMPYLEEQETTHKPHYSPDTLQANKVASDKDIIEVAVANGGRVTPTVLCARLDISIDEATSKLENLHTKGVFTLENTEAGHLVYVLIDFDLMR